MNRTLCVGAAVVLASAACHARSSQPEARPDGGRAAGSFVPGDVNGHWDSKCWTGGPVKCDPRTNLGCDTAAGQVCEIGQNPAKEYTLLCFPPPNKQQLGQRCSRTAGPYCAATLHCAVDGTCRHFCCDATDCPDGDRCIALPGGTFGTIGVCARGPLEAGPDGS